MLAGRSAVVTGAGSGIGRASALALAEAGAAVMVSDVNDDAGAATLAMIDEAGGEAAYTHCDVADPEQCGDLMEATVDRFNRLDVLHANAGVSLPGEDGFAPNISIETWQKVVSVNLNGVFFCCHHAIPRMAKRGGGSIIATASSMGVVPLGGMDAYAATKSAVVGLVRSMGPTCGPLGIRVNAICPGYVETALTEMLHADPEAAEAFAAQHAEPGWQTPEEIADTVVFLASDASRAFTGAALTCDRGWVNFKAPDAVRNLHHLMGEVLDG